MKTENLFVVHKPTFDSEKMDIFNGEATTIVGLHNQFKGGLMPERIHGIYNRKSEAEKVAEKLYQELQRARKEGDPFFLPTEERFQRFVLALEELSTQYGIVIEATGGVTILNGRMKVCYSKDHTSGDLGADVFEMEEKKISKRKPKSKK